MSEKHKSKGSILRVLGGGEVQLILTRQDWETRQIIPDEKTAIAVGQSLVAISAVSYTEFEVGSDLWDFVIEEPIGNDQTQRVHLFIHGEDIFIVRKVSVLA